jgi:hypothetical protein
MIKRLGANDPARRQRSTPSIIEQRIESMPLQFKLIDATLQEELKGTGAMKEVGGKTFATEFRGLIADARKKLAEAKLNVAGAVTRIVKEAETYNGLAGDLHKEADAMEAERRDPSSNGQESDQNQPGATQVPGDKK